MERVSSHQHLMNAWEIPGTQCSSSSSSTDSSSSSSCCICEEDEYSDYHTCLSATMRSSIIGNINNDGRRVDLKEETKEEEEAVLLPITISVGTKRDRSALRRNVSFSSLPSQKIHSNDTLPCRQQVCDLWMQQQQQQPDSLSRSHSVLSFLTLDDDEDPLEDNSETALVTNRCCPCLMMGILSDDAVLHFASFLSVTDLRTFSATCHAFRSLLLGRHPFNAGASYLWLQHARRTWPLLRDILPSSTDMPLATTSLQFFDNLHLPIALAGTDTTDLNEQINTPHSLDVNPSLLLGLSASTHPLAMDSETFCSRNPLEFRTMSLSDLQIRHTNAPTSTTTSSSSSKNKTLFSSSQVMQYVGAVSRGERCIRSNIPLPRPRRNHTSLNMIPSPSSSKTSPSNFMFNLVRRNGPFFFGGPLSTIVQKQQHQHHESFSSDTFIPFVSPYVSEAMTNSKEECETLQVNVTPRLASYFEVTIYPKDCVNHSSMDDVPHRDHEAAQDTMAWATSSQTVWFQRNDNDNDDDDEEDNDDNNSIDPARDEDCIAIGLSTTAFYPYNRMPGWDEHSWGYHSDDGGVFHGSGDMNRSFGPTFGPGDTVGCGMDYAASSSSEHDFDKSGIFFTLNGTFLGYAWDSSTTLKEDVQSLDLYPTIGIDSNCPLSINYGAQPFEFDLMSFTETKQSVVANILGSRLCGREGKKTKTPQVEERSQQ